MHKKIDLSKLGFIIENIAWAVCTSIWYKVLLFRTIPGCTLTTSAIVFWGLQALLISLGVLLSVTVLRNCIMIFANVSIPLELYTLIAYAGDMTALAAVTVCLALLLAAGYFVIVLEQPVLDESRRDRIMQRRRKFALNGSRAVIAFCMLIFILPIAAETIFGDTMVSKNTSAEVPSATEEYTVMNSLATVNKLTEEEWQTLGNSEKADVLQTVANIEACYLGLPHELNLKVDMLEENVIAQYNDQAHTITVNIRYLETDSGEEMLNSVAHECYHAYQYRLIDASDSLGNSEYRNLYAFSYVEEYKEEFQNYSDGNSGDADEYYYQTCEVTARAYAREREQVYMETLWILNSTVEKLSGMVS